VRAQTFFGADFLTTRNSLISLKYFRSDMVHTSILHYFHLLTGGDMKPRLSTEEAITGLLNAESKSNLGTRERHVYREALHALVRLAKSELMMEMKNNVRKLTTASSRGGEHPRKRVHSQRQQQFEFHQDR
jgi:hypothetical protein